MDHRREILGRDENGRLSVVAQSTRMAFDGKLFRQVMPRVGDPTLSDVVIDKQPRYGVGDNYLSEIGWDRHAVSLLRTLQGATEPGTPRFAIENWPDGTNVVKYEFHNTKTGQVGARFYDAGKSYALVRVDNYATPTQLVSRTDYRYQQVPGGAWFPVEVTMTGFHATTGEKVQSQTMTVDLTASVFNDPSAVPDKVFTLEVGQNARVRDYVYGEKLRYSTEATPLAEQSLKRLTSDFVAGDNSKANIHGSKEVALPTSSTGQASSLAMRLLAWALIAIACVACAIGAVWMRRRHAAS